MSHAGHAHNATLLAHDSVHWMIACCCPGVIHTGTIPVPPAGPSGFQTHCIRHQLTLVRMLEAMRGPLSAGCEAHPASSWAASPVSTKPPAPKIDPRPRSSTSTGPKHLLRGWLTLADCCCSSTDRATMERFFKSDCAAQIIHVSNETTNGLILRHMNFRTSWEAWWQVPAPMTAQYNLGWTSTARHKALLLKTTGR